MPIESQLKVVTSCFDRQIAGESWPRQGRNRAYGRIQNRYLTSVATTKKTIDIKPNGFFGKYY
jgi:hypothetical protein